MKSGWLLGFVLIGVVMVDQVLKGVMVGQSNYQLNEGTALGLLSVTWLPWMLVVVWGVVAYYFLKELKIGVSMMAWGMGLIVAAGFSNLLDRLVYGAVVDFICYPVINVCGNLADVVLVVGVGVVGYAMMRFGRHGSNIV